MEDTVTEQTTEAAGSVDPAAEKAAKDAAKAEAKRVKEEAKATAKAEREQKAAAAKQAKVEATAAAKAAKDAAKATAKQERETKKAEAKAARDAARQPEVNGIRRPKPDTLCGKAWAIFDSVSQKNGSPASIGESLTIAKSQNLNEANVRAEYARWRKFHNLSGRIEAPKAPEAATPAAPAPVAQETVEA